MFMSSERLGQYKVVTSYLMESFTLVKPTKVKALTPAILIEVGGEVIVRIDQVGVVLGTSFDIVFGLACSSLVVPVLKIG
jgi:hypothetical protein